MGVMGPEGRRRGGRGGGLAAGGPEDLWRAEREWEIRGWAESFGPSRKEGSPGTIVPGVSAHRGWRLEETSGQIGKVPQTMGWIALRPEN